MSLTEDLYPSDPLDADPDYGVEPIHTRAERLKNARIIGVHERLPMLRVRDLEGDEYFVPLAALAPCDETRGGRE